MSNDKNGRSIEVLLVEDNPGDVRLTMEVLKEEKMLLHVSVVGDGEEALAFLRKEDKYASAAQPDLILLDLNLPKKDGREVLAEIKGDPHLMLIPVVVLTTSTAEQDVLDRKSTRLNSSHRTISYAVFCL